MSNQNMHIVGGTVGTSPGMRFIIGGSNDNIDIDADGVMTGGTATKICLDLSEMLAYRLGKQIPMTANFRINYLRFGLRNVDDTNDNDGPNYFAGDWEFYTPNKHRVDAVQAWRMLENEMEADETTSGLFANTSENSYRGFRFGWDNDTDVSHPTAGAPPELAAGYCLPAMLSVYNNGMKDGTPDQTGAIWDRRVGRSSHLGTHAVCNNGEYIDSTGLNEDINTAFIQDGVWTAPSGHNIVVLGGLLTLNVTHSSVDTIQLTDDDFEVYIDVGISGWSTW